jgi:hypothetical protein
MNILFLIISLLVLTIQTPKQVTCKVVEGSEKVTTLRCDKSLTDRPVPVYYDFPRDEYEFKGCTEVTLERVDDETRIASKQADGCHILNLKRKCSPDEAEYTRRPANITPCEP